MPTYAYACKHCGHRFDAVQSFADPALTECPVCGGPLRKEYGSIGVTFNGSGFYRTDSRSAPKEAGTKDAGGSPGGSAGEKAPTAPASPKPETTKSTPAPSGS